MTDPSIENLHSELKRRYRPSFLNPVAAAIRSSPKLNDSLPVKVAVSLAIRADVMQRHLRAGHAALDVSQTAWAARNLIEVLVWTLFVSQNPTRAGQFNHDGLLDTISIAKAGRALLESVAEADLVAAEQQKVEAMYTQLLDDSSATPDDEKAKYLDVGKTAELVGLGSRFRFLNKFASKFVHSTGYSVMCPPSPRMTGSCAMYCSCGGLRLHWKRWTNSASTSERSRSRYHFDTRARRLVQRLATVVIQIPLLRYGCSSPVSSNSG